MNGNKELNIEWLDARIALRPIYSWYHACIMQPIIIMNTSTRETDNEEAAQNVNQRDPILRCPLA